MVSAAAPAVSVTSHRYPKVAAARKVVAVLPPYDAYGDTPWTLAYRVMLIIVLVQCHCL
jgi:hypothetical protein